MSNEGFFFSNQASGSQGNRKLKSLGCMTCGLNGKAGQSNVPCSGKGERGIMFITETPFIENKHMLNERLFLKKVLSDYGFNPQRDCFFEHSCACVTSNEVKPNQIEACRKRLLNSIRKRQPKVVVLLGKSPIDSIIGNYWTRAIDKVEKWRGFSIPVHDLNSWVCPTFDLSYVRTAQHQESAIPVVFKNDLNSAFHLLKKKLPEKIDLTKRVKVLNQDQAIRHMDALLIKPPKLLAFDFETTGLKPHMKGHDIICCSMCHRPEESVVFWCYRDSQRAVEVRNRIKQVLESYIPKAASQLKFEHSWARVILKAKVKKWDHDTMLGAHVRDNRPGVTSIKFEGFIRFGVSAYQSGIEHYIETRSTNGNAFNALRRSRPAKILPYCGVDSLLEYLTAIDQKKEFHIDED